MGNIYKINHKKNNKRIALMRLFIVFIVILIVGKLFSLQILNKDNLKQKAIQMRQNKALNQAMRGDIVDRNGMKLAASKVFYDIYIDPRQYKMAPEIIAYKLSGVLDVPQGHLVRKLKKIKTTHILAKNVDKKIYKRLKQLKLKCLDIRNKSGRYYPQGKLASHVLGYVNKDARIAAGVESTAQKELEKLPEYKAIQTTAKGHVIYDYDTDPNLASKQIKGEKICLTINGAIQHIAEVELSKMISKTKAKRGSVIVMNPTNGEILGFAVLPNYDPSNYSKYKQSTLKNWALSDVYPPGSTFKILTVASALEKGVISPSTNVLDTGKIKIQGHEIKNYDYKKHNYPGWIGLEYLFEHSSNVGSLKVALRMKDVEFYEMLRKFNIGSKTGVDLPGESAGLLLRPPWKKIRQATIGFGYGVNITPMQLAASVGAVANGGVWVTPHVIKYSDKELHKHVSKKRVMSKVNADKLTKILEKSISNSRSKAGKISNYKVAGKTGTANRPKDNGRGYSGDVYTSFVGFFPAYKPKVLILVVVDSPKGYNVWGSTVAGPVFNEVATQVTRILNITP